SYVWILGLLGLALLTAFAAERILPWHAEWNQSHGDGQTTVIHGIVYLACTLGAIAAVAALTKWYGPLGLTVWPTHWPLLVQLVLALAFVDFVFTIVHVFSHRSALLWRM